MQKLVFILGAVPLLLTAETSATLALQSAPNPSVFGAAVTLNATVTPSSATGSVTFYDGVAILGVAQLSNGQAGFRTSLLIAGAHTLRAYYAGQSANTAQTVNAVAAGGFQQAANFPAGTSPVLVIAADFNWVWLLYDDT